MIKVTRQVELQISPEEWHCYSEMQGVEAVTSFVNQSLMDFINAGMPRNDVFNEMQTVFKKSSSFGFYDGDSNWTLNHVLDKVFGK